MIFRLKLDVAELQKILNEDDTLNKKKNKIKKLLHVSFLQHCINQLQNKALMNSGRKRNFCILKHKIKVFARYLNCLLNWISPWSSR